jgi:lipopolysaccharide transport system ATP-binding protein
MAPVITVDGISKRYELGELGGGGARFSERAMDLVAAPFRGRRRPDDHEIEPTHAHETFWALRDVSLAIEPGEVVGFIGPNGAGKSTLLKLMARITTPTTGRITMRGRVGTLLEVGTGFHPELTGRENIFLNGSILGLSRREIDARFDQIVDYSGVERFIDTPVKRYSSGMYVRLAFAVAAHLDPEILLVDEVLSVGDEEFQRKCLGTLREAASTGRTVVFVSHGMNSVRSLCSRAFLIEKGRITMEGAAETVVRHYLDEHEAPVRIGHAEIGRDVTRVGSGEARFRRAAVLGASGEPLSGVHLGEPLTVAATLEVLETIPDAVFEFGFATPDGLRVASVHNIDEGRPAVNLEPGVHEIRAEVDATLIPGEYALDLAVHRAAGGATIDMVERVVRVMALAVDAEGTDRYLSAKPRGFVRPRSEWNVRLDAAIPDSAVRQ